MDHFSLFGLLVLLPLCEGVQMCVNSIHQEKYLQDSHLLRIQVSGIFGCSLACLDRHMCMSFNFNQDNKECQLSSETKTSASIGLTKHGHFAFSDISHCKVSGCIGMPAGPKNGQFLTKLMQELHPFGTVRPYTCDRGYMSYGKAVCLNNRRWSSAVCMSVSSCSMVKQIRPDSGDGEYWLRHANFDNHTTKIYCHNMFTSSPQEFLSLPVINYGKFPRTNANVCSNPIGRCRGQGGNISFRKIRVNITTMEVDQRDKTFANMSRNETMLTYGGAYACYHANTSRRCETWGRFTINLMRTGWRVSKDQKWEAYGICSKIKFIKRMFKGTTVYLRCGGFPGGCRPSGGLFLTPLPKGV